MVTKHEKCATPYCRNPIAIFDMAAGRYYCAACDERRGNEMTERARERLRAEGKLPSLAVVA